MGANIKNIKLKRRGTVNVNKHIIFVKNKSPASYGDCTEIKVRDIPAPGNYVRDNISNNAPANMARVIAPHNFPRIFYFPRSKLKHNFISGPIHQELCRLKK